MKHACPASLLVLEFFGIANLCVGLCLGAMNAGAGDAVQCGMHNGMDLMFWLHDHILPCWTRFPFLSSFVPARLGSSHHQFQFVRALFQPGAEASIWQGLASAIPKTCIK
jgi:hypothetical protein